MFFVKELNFIRAKYLTQACSRQIPNHILVKMHEIKPRAVVQRRAETQAISALESLGSLFFEPASADQNLLTLPTDPLLLILDYLEVWDLCNFARVSHRGRKLIDAQGDLRVYLKLLRAPAKTLRYLAGRVHARPSGIHHRNLDLGDCTVALAEVARVVGEMPLARDPIFVQPIGIGARVKERGAELDMRLHLDITSPYEQVATIRFLECAGSISLMFEFLVQPPSEPAHWYSISEYMRDRPKQRAVVLFAIEVAKRFRCRNLPYFPESAPIELWRRELDNGSDKSCCVQ